MNLEDEDLAVRQPLYHLLASSCTTKHTPYILLYSLFRAPYDQYIRSEAFLAASSFYPSFGKGPAYIPKQLLLPIAASFAANIGIAGNIGMVWGALWGIWRPVPTRTVGAKLTERVFTGADCPQPAAKLPAVRGRRNASKIYSNLGLGAEHTALVNVAATLAQFPFYCPPFLKC